MRVTIGVMRVVFFSLLVCLTLAAQDDTKARARGVRDIAKQGAGAIPQLTPYLKDPALEVRKEAVKGIAEAGTVQALDPLLSALADEDPEVRIPAISGLTNFYYPGYLERGGFGSSFRKVSRGIKSRFTDTNTQIIDASIQVRPEIITQLGKLVRQDPDLDVRQAAARSIGVLRGKAAIPDLLAALKNKDKDTDLIYESLAALQKIRDPQSAEGAMFLVTDLNERVQIAAIETVGILHYEPAQPRLIEALNRAKSSNKVKRAALGALGMMKDESNRSLFETNLTNKDDGMRASAAEGIGRLKKKEDLPKIEQAFNEEKKMSPRLSLAFACVLLGRTDLQQFSPLDYLINTLNNSNWSGTASPFLEELSRDKSVRESLYPNIAKRTAAEKIELVRILSISGDKDTALILEGLTKDPDSQVGLAATRALRVLRARIG